MPGQEPQRGELRRVSSVVIRLSGPAGQRHVQNGPSTDEAEGKRRVMEQQTQRERERRTSPSVSTVQFRVSPSPCQSEDPLHEYRQYRSSTVPPPSYTRVTSSSPSSSSPSSSSPSSSSSLSSRGAEAVCLPPKAQPSQLCSSLTSAFSPVQPGAGGAQSRKVRQIPISPPTTPRSRGRKPPPGHGGAGSSPCPLSCRPGSPPNGIVTLQPLVLPLPLHGAPPPVRTYLSPEERCPSRPGSVSRAPPVIKPEGSFEPAPLPALIGRQGRGPAHQLPFPSYQEHQLPRTMPPFNSSSPSFYTQSEGAVPERTLTLTPKSCPAVPPGRPSVLSVAPPDAAPSPALVGGRPLPPTPPPGPPLPPTLPTGPPLPSSGAPPSFRARPIGSGDTDALDFDRMKQDILEAVKRELHKVKNEIIDAIRHEIRRISTR